MREIKFRGKDTETGEWFYGDLLQDGKHGRTYIYDNITDNFVNVAPNTVGLSTGLRDKNNKEIYKSDIVKHDDYIGIIKFGKYCIYINWVNDKYNILKKDIATWITKRLITVVGNIYDNPELIRSEKNDKR